MALAATGEHVPSAEVAGQALRAVSGYRVDAAQVASVLSGLSELPAHGDVLPAAELLAGAGMRLGCLTNGSAALTASFVDRAGLGPYIERVISVQEAGTWKPVAVVYPHAAAVLGVEPGRLALVAAHAWDCHGASRAGLVTGWVSRLERGYSPIFAPPDRHRCRPHRGLPRPAGPARWLSRPRESLLSGSHRRGNAALGNVTTQPDHGECGPPCSAKRHRRPPIDRLDRGGRGEGLLESAGFADPSLFPLFGLPLQTQWPPGQAAYLTGESMTYNEYLADRVRAALPAAEAVTERQMFGGLAFMLGGHMFCGVVKDSLMVRLGPDAAERALGLPHVRPMDFTGRPMKDMIFVDPGGLHGAAVRYWVDAAADHARRLPPKQATPADRKRR
jgi:2-haloacid dehalogenase